MHQTSQEAQLWAFLDVEVDQEEFTQEEAIETAEDILAGSDLMRTGEIKWDESDQWYMDGGIGPIVEVYVETPLWDNRVVVTQFPDIHLN